MSRLRAVGPSFMIGPSSSGDRTGKSRVRLVAWASRLGLGRGRLESKRVMGQHDGGGQGWREGGDLTGPDALLLASLGQGA